METNSGQRARIFIVEDDGIIASYLEQMLAASGYTVVGLARSGEEMLEKVAEASPDLLLVDIHLAGEMNGIEAAERLRTNSDVPLIYLTAYTDERLLQKAKVTQPLGYLLKPAQDVELLAAIEIALHRHALEKGIRARERWLKTTLSDISDAVFATDRDGRTTFLNTRAEAFIDIAQDDVLGQPLGDVVSLSCDEIDGALGELIDRAIEHQEAIRLTGCLLSTPAAREVAIEGSITPIQEEGAQVTGAVLACRDVSEYKQAKRSLQVRTAQLEMLREVGLEISGQLDLDVVLHSIARRAVELLGGTDGGIYLYRSDRDALEWAVAVTPSPLALGAILHKGEGLAGKVWETGRPLYVENYHEWEGRASIAEEKSFLSVVGAPVRWGEQFLGVLNVNGDASRVFDQADAELLNLFATQAATAIRNARFYEEAQRRSMEQKLVARIAYALNTLDLRDAFPVLVDNLRELTGCERVSLVLFDATGEHFTVSILNSSSSGLREGITMPAETTAAAEDIAKGRPHLTPDLAAERDFPAENLLWEAGLRSRINLPLIVGGEGIGALNLASSEPHFFDERDLPVLEQIAEVVVSAVENGRLFEEEQRRRQEADTLRETALVLTSALNEEKVIEHILTQLRKVVPYDSCSVQLLRDASLSSGRSGRLEIVGGYGFADPAAIVGLSFPVGGDNPNTEVVRVRGPVIFSDAPQIYEDFQKDPHVQTPIRSWLGVPMMIGDRLVGIIALDKREEAFYTTRHARMVEAFAAHAAVAIENAGLHRQIVDYAEHLEQRVDAKVRELDRARAKVVHAGKMASLGELATSVAHELNQPLTSILYEAQYLEKLAQKIQEEPPGLLDWERIQFHTVGEKIAADVERCRKLINHLRTFGRLPKLEIKGVEVNEAIENCFILVGERLRQAGVVVRRDLTPGLPLVFADLHKLEQIFLNLISNAEYAVEEMARRVAEGEIDRPGYQKVVEISSFVEGDKVVVLVRDNGCGMPEPDRDRIFEPFFTTKPVGKGTGLGLSISQEIISSFDGDISFESIENEGTGFWVRLPVPETPLEPKAAV